MRNQIKPEANYADQLETLVTDLYGQDYAKELRLSDGRKYKIGTLINNGILELRGSTNPANPQRYVWTRNKMEDIYVDELLGNVHLYNVWEKEYGHLPFDILKKKLSEFLQKKDQLLKDFNIYKDKLDKVQKYELIQALLSKYIRDIILASGHPDNPMNKTRESMFKYAELFMFPDDDLKVAYWMIDEVDWDLIPNEEPKAEDMYNFQKPVDPENMPELGTEIKEDINPNNQDKPTYEQLEDKLVEIHGLRTYDAEKIKRLEAEIDNLTDKLKEAADGILMEELIAEKDRRIRELAKSYEQSLTENRQLKEENEMLKERIAQLEEKSKNEVNVEEERRNTEEENIRGHYIQRIKDLEAELDKERKEKQDIQTSYDNLKVLYDTLLLDKNNIEEEKNTMEEDFRQQKESLESTIKEFENKNTSDSNKLMEEHQKEINEHKAAAEATSIEISNLNQKIGVLEKEKEDFDERYNSLKTKYEEAISNQVDPEVEQTLRNEIERLENELESNNNSNEINDLRNKYEQELQEKDEEMTRLINTNETLVKDIEELKSKSMDLDNYVTKAEYESVRQDAIQAEKKASITLSNYQQSVRDIRDQKEEYERKLATFANRVKLLEERLVLLEGKRSNEIEEEFNNQFLGNAISTINEVENIPDPEPIQVEQKEEEDIPESLRDFFSM